VDYSWPGNIRELENMMKRFVVLQDENFIQNELTRLAHDERPIDRTPAPAAPMPPADAEPAEPSVPANGVAYASTPAEDVVNGMDSDEGVDLQAVVKDAVLRLERDAIAQALVRFRWNRRKAASHLRVSYKTLLNKMKECGITDPEGT